MDLSNGQLRVSVLFFLYHFNFPFKQIPICPLQIVSNLIRRHAAFAASNSVFTACLCSYYKTLCINGYNETNRTSGEET